MVEKIISKDKIKEYLESLMPEYKVVAPVRRFSAPAEFKEISPKDDYFIDGSEMMAPPKDYLLPRYEVLFKAETKKGQEKVETTLPTAEKRAIFGMWLPDAQGIAVLDKVFLDGKYNDPYYANRRENSVLVAVLPNEPRWSWFCSSVDKVDEWKKNVDVLMYDIDYKYYCEFYTEKGEALIKDNFFNDPSEADTVKKNEVWSRFVEYGKQPFAEAELYEKLSWDNPIWEEIADKCIGCGVCSYTCPSCSCFDIQDDVCGSCVERYRCRDTCQFEDFTLMGHGHNPRDQKVPRSRQRLMHKFQYQHEQFGVVGCTGCGRCVESCPVNVDIRDVLNRTCCED
ncbi:MAG: 4Fe-4S dicluster domain-containing protein [Armatimonadota bacterium]